MSETQKWVNLGLLGGALVVFLFLDRLFGFVWEAAHWSLLEEWPVHADALAAFLVAAGAGLWIRRWARANQFLNEVAVELGKVSWPARKETVTSSGVVAVLVGIAALLLAVIDLMWGTVSRGVFHF